MNFTELHQQKSPLIIANIWDAGSAIAAQQAGYQALATSSAAIAAMLGYEDGEAIAFDEMHYIVTRIKSVTHLPLSVDLEAGFGRTTDEIAAHLIRLARPGVVGINLEDSRVVNGCRQLNDAEVFAATIKQLRNAVARESPLFFNIRTDTFLLDHKQAVAAANGANRIAIVIPCHRIIGKDGALTGYGGGIARKAWLIEHEKRCLMICASN
ncbi:methylated-DNA--[protein]-cysteine S-methyltransferase [Leclercia adecarboxylata]|uniref:methylated-DNA--[protein]-cysteine S-methyltransferase n=1 Tax=Leclercia adecarboxylata TaxID=83655 RepID=UPI002DB92294|nr:methylated-DNA--[protein]-cysteine S-methyltransferase [Leclercia adecarboxylata]MEB6379005.1 methylated-DNA--[protein]-cysteine S-methyltransferase [Leclercia adecarboxylata]